MILKVLEIDLDAARLGDVHHRHDDHHRQLQFAEKKREIEIAFDRGGVDHVDEKIRLVRKDVAEGGLFVFARGGEGVDSGQIDESRVTGERERKFTLLLFHRDAGPVADMLFRACKRVEDGGLAAVGVSDDSDGFH